MSLPLFRLLSNEGKKYYNIIILKSYQADVHVSTKKKGTQRAQLYTFLQKDILLRRIYPKKRYSTCSVIYIFTERYVIEVTNSETQLCSNLVRVNKVLRCIQQPQQGTPGRTPSLFDKCTWFFYVRYRHKGKNGFLSHPKDEPTVKCLA